MDGKTRIGAAPLGAPRYTFYPATGDIDNARNDSLVYMWTYNVLLWFLYIRDFDL